MYSKTNHSNSPEAQQQKQVLEILKEIQQDLFNIHRELSASSSGSSRNILLGDDLMDTASVCAFLSISDRQLRRYKAQKLITAVKLGKRRLFRMREVRRFYDEYIKECK